MRTRIAVPVLITTLLLGCDRTPADPAVDALYSTVLTEIEKPVLEEEAALVDKDGDGLVCVKNTPSDHLVLKEANPTPSQACPPSFLHKGKGSTIKWEKEWFSEDENRNGVICAKQTGSGSWVVKDDSEATPSQPCPPAFYVAGSVKPHKVPAEDLAAADDNRNGHICLKVAEGTGNFLIHDDNTATPSQPCPPAFAIEATGEVIEVPADPKG
jgi:hypothetical protein